MEVTFTNTPLDLWRSRWSSGRRRTLTEEWVLLCFQSTVQLVQGACVLQHLWSLNAPTVTERNSNNRSYHVFLHSYENEQFTFLNLKHILQQSHSTGETSSSYNAANKKKQTNKKKFCSKKKQKRHKNWLGRRLDK